MFIVNNISKKYHNKKIFERVNLQFNDKGLYLVTGASGIGKSTLLNIIGLLENPDEGEIIYNNQNLTNLSQSEKIMYISTYYGFVFQEYNLIEELTVYDNIEIAFGTETKNNLKAKIFNVLEQVKISFLADKKVKYLSGGEKQRVAIARSLIKDAKIILVDEPTSNLDKENSKIISEILNDISQTKLVICATHDPILIHKFSDRIIAFTDYGIKVKLKEEKASFDYYNEPKLRVGKLKLSNILMIILESIKKTLSKTITTISVLAILLIISMLLISISFYHPIEAYSKKLIEENIRYSNLVDSHFNNIPADKYHDLSKLFNYDLFPYYGLDIDIEDYSINRAFIISDNKLGDDEILITDYIAEVLVKTNYFSKVNSIDKLNNKVIDYQGVPLTIKGIYDTDYESFADINIDSFYSSIFLNKNTLDKLMKFDEQLEIRYYSDTSDDWNYVLLEKYHNDITFLIGNDNFVNNYDIIVSSTLLNEINKEFKIEELKLSIEKNEFTFNIIGIFHDEEPKIIVSETDYLSLKYIVSDNGIILATNQKLNELNQLQKNDIYLNSPFLSTYLNIVKVFGYIRYITIITLMIIILIMYHTYKVFVNQRITSRKRDIGILLSLGISKNRINSIFIYDSTLIIFVSYIIASILSLWLLGNFVELFALFKIGFSFDLLNAKVYILIFIISLFLNIIFELLLLKKIYKIKFVDLLRKE